MVKKFLIVLVVIAVSAAVLVPAFAATTKALTPVKQQQIDKLQQQIYDLRIQMLDKYVEAGVMTKENADAMKVRMKQRISSGTFGGGKNCGGQGNCGNGGGGCGARAGTGAVPQININ